MPKASIELYPAQDDFVACRQRFTAMIGGIGSGKSYAGNVKAFLRASERKTLGMVTAPTYRMLQDATLRTFMDVTRGFVRTWSKSDMTATLVNGSEVLFRSADNPETLRGPNLFWWFGDEASLYDKSVWLIMIGRLRADGGAGEAWLATTPKGRNWLYERQGEIAVFRAKTRDNPYLSDEFVSSLEAAYSGSFARQELEGEFVSFEGLVYEDFDRGRHVTDKAGPFVRTLIGVDEGYTNPAVLLPVGVDNDGRAHVVDEFYKRRVLQGDVVAEARRMNEVYQPDVFVVDPSAAGLIAEMRSVGLRVNEATNDVMPGIQAVKARLATAGDGRPRLTVGPACANLLAEFESYVWKEGRAGMKDEPEKVNDHALDALRYVVMALTRGPSVTTVRNPWN